MSATKISNTIISSFVGDVLPLWLISEEDLKDADIKWSVLGNAVHLRTFEKEKDLFNNRKTFGLNHGVLVTLDKVGSAEIVAEYDGETFICKVESREAIHTESGRMNYYTADLHNHTTLIHNHDELYKRDGDFQEDYVRFIKNADDIDLSAITDHADVIDQCEFFKGFVEVENAKPMNPIILPGAESEITLIETDRYGQSHKNSGEIVTLCADNFAPVKTHAEFFELMKTSPHLIATLAHPQVVGYDKNGIWNFCLEKHREDGFREVVKLVEMGDGRADERDDDLINEFIYSVALDNGFRVSTTCSSDRHNAPWGKTGYKGKTVVMAPEKSKEAFIDALRSGRCYCSESGNLIIYCEINGQALPCDLSPCQKYKFHVEVDYFEADESSVPVKCSVISDYGETIAEISDVDFSSFDFELENNSARWFYLKFVDSAHKRTFSPPAYLGREYDAVEKIEPKPICKTDFEAKDIASGTDASQIINDNPLSPWESDNGTAEILIDMKQNYTVSAIGHYPYVLVRQRGVDATPTVASFAAEYEVSLSSDGESFECVASGAVRVYGGEVIIKFAPRLARYVKFSVKSNVGKIVGYDRYKGLGLKIGELTVFE